MTAPKRNKNTIWSGRYALVIALTVLALAGTYTQALQWLERRGFDVAAYLLPEESPSDEVVVLAIDEQALERVGQWPWSRGVLARGIDHMRKDKVKTIGLMLPLDERQTPTALDDAMLEIEAGKEAIEKRITSWKSRPNNAERRRQLERLDIGMEKLDSAAYWLGRVDTDRQLAYMMSRAGHVVLLGEYISGEADQGALPAQGLTRLGDEPPRYWYQSDWLRFVWSGPDDLGTVHVSAPIGELGKSAAAVGVAPMARAMRVRQAPLAVRVDDQTLASFTTLVAAAALDIPPNDLKALGQFTLSAGKTAFPAAPDFAYYPRPPVTRDGEPPVRRYSFAELLNKSIGAEQLQDKVVLVGLTAPGLAPLYRAPGGAELTPVEWAAHSVAGLVSEDYIRMPSWFYALQRALILGLALFLLLLPARLYDSTAGVLITVILALLLLNAELVILITSQVWLPLVLPMLFLLGGYTLMAVRQRVRAAILHGRDEAFEARRLLGINLQAQGQLDQAFAEFQKCQLDQNTLYNLYQLGQDFERRRKFTKALEVYEYMAQEAPRYRDIADRLKRLKAVPDSNTARFTSAEAVDATLVLDDSAIEKPMLGRYRLEAQLGRGAMGIVYLGVDPKIGRKVAIKTLNLTQEFEGTDLDEVKWRFYREAEASGRLQHKNIVTVYDVGEEHDLAYIAMDYVEGASLDKYIKEENLLEVSEVLLIGAQVADALDYAHKQQVVHRDIKPANVIYDDKSPAVKITDFGIACLTDNSKTRTGTLLGTPAYMSPEQITGESLDGRSDLYSLGVTLYQLLTGDLPFSSDSMANLVFKITSEKPKDIRSLRPELSPDISRVISKCLQKDPNKRYQTGANMSLALRKVLAMWEAGPSDVDFI